MKNISFSLVPLLWMQSVNVFPNHFAFKIDLNENDSIGIVLNKNGLNNHLFFNVDGINGASSFNRSQFTNKYAYTVSRIYCGNKWREIAVLLDCVVIDLYQVIYHSNKKMIFGDHFLDKFKFDMELNMWDNSLITKNILFQSTGKYSKKFDLNIGKKEYEDDLGYYRLIKIGDYSEMKLFNSECHLINNLMKDCIELDLIKSFIYK